MFFLEMNYDNFTLKVLKKEKAGTNINKAAKNEEKRTRFVAIDITKEQKPNRSSARQQKK